MGLEASQSMRRSSNTCTTRASSCLKVCALLEEVFHLQEDKIDCICDLYVNDDKNDG